MFIDIFNNLFVFGGVVSGFDSIIVDFVVFVVGNFGDFGVYFEEVL